MPPIVARQRLGKHVPAATNTHNRRIVGLWFFVRSVSYGLDPWVYPLIVAKKRLGKHVPAAKNCWRRRLLSGLCRINAKYAISSSQNFLLSTATCFVCQAYSSTPKMVAIRSFETSVKLYKTTRRHIPKDSTFNNPGLFSFTFASVKGENRHLTLCIKYLKCRSCPLRANCRFRSNDLRQTFHIQNDNENIKLIKLCTM
jgi:hypothetical protein